MEISAKRYVDLIVEFLERVGYDEPEGSRQERAQSLRYVFRGTMEHFTRPCMRDVTADYGYLTSVVRTITRMTVFGWGSIPLHAMVPLNIYFTYVILEDDPKDDPLRGHPYLMESFVLDLLRGEEQLHPRYRALFSFFPDLLRCYGKFQQLTMLKSTLELIQGFWIERRRFGGFPGSNEYPMFLRRLNGLGDFSGASLFPVAQFDEDQQFDCIVTVIAQVEPVVALVNDLFSFYKEASAEETCLVNSICSTEGVGSEQVLRRVVDHSVRAVRKLREVIEIRQSPGVTKTVNDFIRGYIRWHLCDERYRMSELDVQCGDEGTNAVKFQRFRQIACRAGCVGTVDFHVL